MKLFKKMKDGGNESSVTGYWLVEIKSLFSIVLLNFQGESREAYHTHAFNALSWVLKGKLIETLLDKKDIVEYRPSFKPIFTSRQRFHKVSSNGSSWVLSIRGPWQKTWHEYLEQEKRLRALTHGRKELT